MKIQFLIRLTRGVLLAFTLVLGGMRSNSEGTSTVTAKRRTFDAVTTFEGTATHYTRRGKDKFSIGYYVKDGAIIKERSLLADKDGPVSNLDLDILAKGEGFDSVGPPRPSGGPRTSPGGGPPGPPGAPSGCPVMEPSTMG